MRQKKHTCAEGVDLERLAIDLQSPEEAVRAKAVSSLCPCRVGFGLFQMHLDTLARFRKDSSPAVRASALHVFEDAGEMQSEGHPTHPREATDEMLRRRRASRFLPDDTGDARERRAKRGKGR